MVPSPIMCATFHPFSDVGYVLCSCDIQIGFCLEKKEQKSVGSETSQICLMLLTKKILLHQGIVRSLFLYIDFHKFQCQVPEFVRVL